MRPDPENRFVAGELEARWNRALTRGGRLRADAGSPSMTPPLRPVLPPVSFDVLARGLRGRLVSSDDRRAVEEADCAKNLIHEAVADIDDSAAEIVLTLHWVGGTHTEHRPPRRRRGQRTSTPQPTSSRPFCSCWR